MSILVFPQNVSVPFMARRGGYTYATAVQSIPNLIQYLQLNETSGTTAADSSGNGCTGTYVNSPTLADTPGPGATMGSAPRFTSSSSQYVNVFTSALAALFSQAEGSFSIWVKAVNSGFWTDGTYYWATEYANSLNNRIAATKEGSVSNSYRAYWIRNGVQQAIAKTSFNPTAWFNVVVTWKVSGVGMRLYIDGSQVGSDTGVSAWTVTPLLAATVGARSDAAFFMNGWLAHLAAFSRQLTAGEVTTLSTAF